MIVYNVNRCWFAMKGDAEKYRIRERLPPDATIKIGIEDRTQLAALLDALCEPPRSSTEGAVPAPSIPERVIDNAFVDPDFEIPKFLRDSWARLMAGKGD
ncbi:MAG: hypothetical protein WCY29_18240 [Novosphingobium sp.]